MWKLKSLAGKTSILNKLHVHGFVVLYLSMSCLNPLSLANVCSTLPSWKKCSKKVSSCLQTPFFSMLYEINNPFCLALITFQGGLITKVYKFLTHHR